MALYQVFNGSHWSSEPVQMPTWLHQESDLDIVDKTFRLLFLVTLLLVAIFLNGTIAYVLMRKRRLSTAGNQLTFSLTLSLFVGSTWSLVTALGAAIKGHWMMGETMCHLTGFIHLLIILSSNATIAMIAVDRHYAIARPMMYHGEFSRRRLLSMLAMAWICSTIVASCPILGWSQFAYHPGIFACSLVWGLQPVFSGLVIIFGFCVPLLIISVFYTQIYFAANVQHVANQTLSRHSVSVEEEIPQDTTKPIHTTPKLSPQCSPQIPLLSKRQRLFRDRLPWVVITYSSPAKALRTIFVLVGGFMLSWTPFIIAILCQIGGVRSSRLAFAGHFFQSTSSVMGPVVYGLMNKMIRHRVKRLFTRGKQKQAISLQYSPSLAGSFFDYIPRKLSNVGLPHIDPADAVRMVRNFSSPAARRKATAIMLAQPPSPATRRRLGTMTRPGSAPGAMNYMAPTSPQFGRRDHTKQDPSFLTIPEEVYRRASPNFVVGTNIVSEPQTESNPTEGNDVEASIVIRVMKQAKDEEIESSDTDVTKKKCVRLVLEDPNNVTLKLEVQDVTPQQNHVIFSLPSDLSDNCDTKST